MLNELINSKEPGEIEHIFPANPNVSLDKSFVRPNYISKLENVCLLEAKLNKKVSNHMLKEKDKKDNEVGKLESYKDSKFSMPKMLCYSECLTDENGCFGNEQAQRRIKLIFNKFGEQTGEISFSNMLKEVQD